MKRRDKTIPYIPPAVLRQMESDRISKRIVLAVFRSRPWQIQQEQLAKGLYGPKTTWKRSRKLRGFSLGITYTFDGDSNRWVILSVRKFTLIRHTFPPVGATLPANTVQPVPQQDRLFE